MASAAFSQYANKLVSSTSTVANPLFYSTYDGSHDHDDAFIPQDRDSDDNDNDDMEQHGRITVEDEAGARGPHVEYPASRLWQNVPNLASSFTSMLPSNLNRVSRGWKAHLSTAEVYQERFELDDDQDEPEAEDMSSSTGSLSPPEFLSRPLPSASTLPCNVRSELTIPLIPPSTLYVYPSSGRGAGGRIELRKYRNSTWIVIYGTSLMGLILVGINEWINNGTSVNYPIIPVLPLLILLSVLSVIAGISSLAYLILVRNSIRHLILISLIGGPAILVMIGIGGVSGSFNDSGIEHDSRWKNGLRVFSLVCFIAAYVLGNMGLKRRKQANRTIKVLELASSVVISHSPILILCLALSLSSALLTLPFLAILSNLLSSTNLSFYSKLTSGFVLVTWVWTLSIIRGIQRVTVAGVVGSWYFDRHEESHPSAIEVTNKSFERATGPSLGTVIGASFVTSLFSSLSYFARQSRAVLRSAHFPTLLSPLTYLVPILAMISGSLEIFGGYCLCYTGLTGDDLVSSARRTKDLLLANRTVGLGDNLLTKLILTVTAFTLSMLAGLISFLIISAHFKELSYLPLVATLCFTIPFSSMRLCSNVLNDACDTLFLTWNIDLDTGVEHCVKASEAFAEPDGEGLA